MKYKLPKQGSTRVIKKFALFPIVTSDNYRVWFDHYYVNQEYIIIRGYDYSYFGWSTKYTSAYLDDPQLRS